MRQVTGNLAVFSSDTEMVLAIRDKGSWFDAVHVRWADVPMLLTVIEREAIERRTLTEWVTLQSQFEQVCRELDLCRRHLMYRAQELARWSAFESAAEERLRALGVAIPADHSLPEAVLAWMDHQRDVRKEER